VHPTRFRQITAYEVSAVELQFEEKICFVYFALYGGISLVKRMHSSFFLIKGVGGWQAETARPSVAAFAR
jgi:hypothetical protein